MCLIDLFATLGSIIQLPLSAFPNQELQDFSVVRPGPLRPATDLHERLQPLARLHAPGALPDETGPGAVQGPGFHPEEEIQGHREAVTGHKAKC